MNQKEQIKSIVHSFDIGGDNINETVDKLAQNQDEFSIGFTNWCEDNYFSGSIKGIWFNHFDFHTADKFTTIELLEIYKDQL